MAAEDNHLHLLPASAPPGHAGWQGVFVGIDVANPAAVVEWLKYNQHANFHQQWDARDTHVRARVKELLAPRASSHGAPCKWCGGSLPTAGGVCAPCERDMWHEELQRQAMGDNSNAEFVADYFVGYRTWSATDDQTQGWVLVGQQAYVWPRMERAEAKCEGEKASSIVLGGGALPHGYRVAPCGWKTCSGYGHGCGFYAVKDYEVLRRRVQLDGRVVGKVALWGKVIEHSGGYRAQYAYPLELYSRGASTRLALEDERVLAVADAYCVPVVPPPDDPDQDHPLYVPDDLLPF